MLTVTLFVTIFVTSQGGYWLKYDGRNQSRFLNITAGKASQGGLVKKTFAFITALSVLLLAAGTAFAATGFGREKEIRIHGTIQELENDEVLFPTIYLHGNGSGSATELGQFTMHFEGVVYNNSAGVGVGVEGANYTAANGDKIFATNTGLGVPTTTAGVNKIVEKYTITGGTGRYADASGNFTVERLVTLQTGASSGTIKGSIELH